MGWFKKTERYLVHVRKRILTLMFLLGFVLDNLTLNSVDQKFDNFVLSTYVVLAMTGIVLLYAGIAERFSERVSRFFYKWSPMLIQYAFGGLLSGMLIFYGRSSSLIDSWPYILVILVAIYGNETIRNRDQRFVYNLAIFFVGMFSYVVLLVPVVLGKMGPLVFVGSGFVALFVMYWFFRLLSRVVPHFILLQKRIVVFTIGLIYVGFNILYFTNIIPPIPLSLKDAGIFHNVVRAEDGIYSLTYEKPTWWHVFQKDDVQFHARPGDALFCYASVFTPMRLSVKVFHRWEYFDEESNVWKEHGRYAYTIAGGRGDGYRGYTQVSNYTEGKWRCTVETERGQVLGREVVTVVEGTLRELVTRTQ